MYIWLLSQNAWFVVSDVFVGRMHIHIHMHMHIHIHIHVHVHMHIHIHIHIYIICVYRNNWMKRNKMPIVNFCKTFGNIFSIIRRYVYSLKNVTGIDGETTLISTDAPWLRVSSRIHPKLRKSWIFYKRNRHGIMDNYRPVSLLTSFQLYFKKLQIQLTKLLQNQPRLLAQVRPTTLPTEPPAVLTTVAICTRANRYWSERVICCYSDISCAYTLHVMLPFASR